MIGVHDNTNDSKAGLTLIEVMIASLVLSLSLLGFLSGLVMSVRSSVMSDQTATQMHLARKEMETIFAHRYEDPELLTGTHTIPSGNYTVTMNGTYSDTKDISLTVHWSEPGSSRTSTVSLASSMTKGLHE